MCSPFKSHNWILATCIFFGSNEMLSIDVFPFLTDCLVEFVCRINETKQQFFRSFDYLKPPMWFHSTIRRKQLIANYCFLPPVHWLAWSESDSFQTNTAAVCSGVCQSPWTVPTQFYHCSGAIAPVPCAFLLAMVFPSVRSIGQIFIDFWFSTHWNPKRITYHTGWSLWSIERCFAACLNPLLQLGPDPYRRSGFEFEKMIEGHEPILLLGLSNDFTVSSPISSFHISIFQSKFRDQFCPFCFQFDNQSLLDCLSRNPIQISTPESALISFPISISFALHNTWISDKNVASGWMVNSISTVRGSKQFIQHRFSTVFPLTNDNTMLAMQVDNPCCSHSPSVQSKPKNAIFSFYIFASHFSFGFSFCLCKHSNHMILFAGLACDNKQNGF